MKQVRFGSEASNSELPSPAKAISGSAVRTPDYCRFVPSDFNSLDHCDIQMSHNLVPIKSDIFAYPLFSTSAAFSFRMLENKVDRSNKITRLFTDYPILVAGRIYFITSSAQE